ncbi:Dehydrodolichyl diphosphate synthase 2 [Camellia lanceoleosa]|nr:Dehydrodolichyl diphosphate synthase 2 [Camellia lanceoleosa]
MLLLRFPVPPPCKTSLSPSSQHKPIPPPISLISKTNQTNIKISHSLPKVRKPVVSSAPNAAARGGQQTETVVSNNGHLSAEEEELPEGLQRDLMPKHVAVILDGNRRWGQQRGLPVDETHRAGGQKIREIASLCHKWGVKVLSVFAFSTENWVRPQEEVDILMNLFGEQMISYFGEAMRTGVRVSMIGDKSKLPKIIQNIACELEESTKANTQFHIIAALNYGGQQDITQACKKVAGKVKEGLIQVEDINNNLIEEELETNCTEYPNPDLLIRTSGEIRVSNFMLWQLAYTEMLFVDKLWPDFEESDFVEALRSFQQRQRRYGGQA